MYVSEYYTISRLCTILLFLIYVAMNESGVQWSVANEEDYKNGERLVIKHNKVSNNSKNDLNTSWRCVSLIG